jgi:hypothetical protein
VVRSVLAICVWLSTGVGVQPPDRSGPEAFSETQAVSRAERHAVRGTVQSMSDNSLTITRASRRGDVLVFTLDESTVRSGVIAVGVMVSVRYRYEGSVRLAIAVNGPPPAADPR